MPIAKISLTEEEYQTIRRLAEEADMSIQDLVRYQLLGKKNPDIFTPEEAY